MKLDPKQVQFRTPILSAFSRSTVPFARKRSTIHLQETAMVLEGDLLQFQYLGIERFFARAVSEYSTVTVPYSRLMKVKYRRKWVYRGLVLLIAGFLTLLTALIWLVTYLILRLIPPVYSVVYRNPDGAKRRFSFRIKSRAVRKEFDAALAKYRESAGRFAERDAR